MLVTPHWFVPYLIFHSREAHHAEADRLRQRVSRLLIFGSFVQEYLDRIKAYRETDAY